jgi:hypothetical protein
MYGFHVVGVVHQCNQVSRKWRGWHGLGEPGSWIARPAPSIISSNSCEAANHNLGQFIDHHSDNANSS